MFASVNFCGIKINVLIHKYFSRYNYYGSSWCPYIGNYSHSDYDHGKACVFHSDCGFCSRRLVLSKARPHLK